MRCITNSWSLLRLRSIELVMPSNHLILCHPLLLLPSIPHSIRVFSNESVLRIRWPKYWSFSFRISPSNVYSGLISFRMDWLDLLAVQGTLNSLLQHHSSKASILQHSAFFIVQLSHPHMTTGKNIALTTWTFVGKIMSLLFNMLFRLIIAFLGGSHQMHDTWPFTFCDIKRWKVWKYIFLKAVSLFFSILCTVLPAENGQYFICMKCCYYLLSIYTVLYSERIWDGLQ